MANNSLTGVIQSICAGVGTPPAGLVVNADFVFSINELSLKNAGCRAAQKVCFWMLQICRQPNWIFAFFQRAGSALRLDGLKPIPDAPRAQFDEDQLGVI